MKDIKCLDLTEDPTQYWKMPRSIDITLDENELKFLINLMWSTDSYKTKSMAERLNIVDEALEGRLVKCLGYCALQDDWSATL